MKQNETRIGPYEIKAKIGQGGTSIVYRAVDTRAERVVALKVLTPLFATDPKFLRRFINEGQNVKRLNHPNIVQVYDANEADGRQFIAMELVEGGSLSELIKNRNSLLPVDDALRIIEQIAAALDYAHGLGILHRDIKLSNILLTQDGRALLSDFGSAKHMYGEHTIVTQSGFSVGTPTFMSPEQAKGDPSIDRRTDVYSLGVAAYAVLVGRLPFKADSQVALLHKIIYEAPPLPELANPDIAPGIAYALKRVLSKEPPMRYSTAGEFAASLIEGKSWVPGTQDYTNIPIFPHGTGTFFVPHPEKRANRGFLRLLPLLLLSSMTVLGLTLVLILWTSPQLWQPVPTPTEIPQLVSAFPSQRVDPIVLTMYEDPTGGFSINVPENWLQSASAEAVNFDSPDFFARLFVHKIDNLEPASTPDDVIERYLNSVDETYGNPEVISDGSQIVGDKEVREKVLSASWLGTDVIVRLVGTVLQDRGYIIGSIVESQYDPLLSTILSSVAGSFQGIDAVVQQVTPTEGPTSTPVAPATTPATLALADSQSTILASPSRSPSQGGFEAGIESTARTPIRQPSYTPTDNPPTSTATEQPADRVVLLPPTATQTRTDTPTPTKLATPSATATDQPTATETSQPTATPTDTATSTPTRTATATSTHTAVATPTQTATHTQTATNTATSSPTNTPVPPTSASIGQLSLLSTSTATRMATATPTRVTATPTTVASSAVPISGAQIEPIQPPQATSSGGRVTFEWTTNFTPRPNQGFELVFWRSGQSPIANSFGLAAPTRETNVKVDLDSLDTALGDLLEPGSYQWGILLVQQNPYRRIQYLGGDREFKFVRGRSSSGSKSPSSGE